MQNGVTVSPIMVETAEGDQIADFSVDGHPGGYDSGRPGYEGSEYVIDNRGTVHHQYENVDFESLDEYQEPQQDLPADYLTDIQSLFGGSEGYLRATQWAKQHLNQDFIDEFNEAMNSGDPDLMTPHIEQLLSMYQGTDSEEDVIDEVPFDPDLQAEIYQAIGGEGVYDKLTSWATENLSEEAVDNYNAAMDSGDERLIRTAVQWLVGQYK